MAYSRPHSSVAVTKKEKKWNLTCFFRDLLKKRIDFQISSDETKDIVAAVDSIVKEIVHRVTTNVAWLGPSHRLRVLKVGSMADRTSIGFPDEFDYLVVTRQDGVKVERMCEREGYAHIKVTDRRLQSLWKPFLHGDYLKGSFRHDFSGKMTELVNYGCSAVQKWLREDPLHYGPDKSLLDPYFDSLENAFMAEVARVIEKSIDDTSIKCKMNTGTLHVNKHVVNHGPAFMPTFIWTPKHGKHNTTITVDITLAIEVDMSQHMHMIKENDAFRPWIWEKLVQHGKFMLIHCNDSTSCVAGLCFRLTFTETEVELVRGMSKHHKDCYRLLKYIFNSGSAYSYLPSYVFKMLVIKHDCFCRETTNLATCFKNLVASLLYLVVNAKDNEKIELSRLLPGRKFHLIVPSIFMKKHNVLDGKNFLLPREPFLSAIEKMLESIQHISTKAHPDETNLKIVNNYGTAAQSYVYVMSTVKQKELKFCECCLNEYFRPYGPRTSESSHSFKLGLERRLPFK